MNSNILPYAIRNFSNRSDDKIYSCVQIEPCFFLMCWEGYDILQESPLEFDTYTENSVLMLSGDWAKVIGSCVFNSKKNQVEQFIIYDEYRNAGNARKFLKMLIDKFYMRSVNVYSDNLPAISLYKSTGFVVDYEFSDHVSYNGNLYHMILDVT